MPNSNIDRAKRMDYAAGVVIRLGGVLIILTVVLMLVFIFRVALPLFLPADFALENTLDLKPMETPRALAIGLDDYREVAYTLTSSGEAIAYSIADGLELKRIPLRNSAGNAAAVFSWDIHDHAILWEDQSLTVVRAKFPVSFSQQGARSVGFEVETLAEFGPPAEKTISSTARVSEEMSLRMDLLPDGRFRVLKQQTEENFLGERTVTETIGYTAPPQLGKELTAYALDTPGAFLYAGSADGFIYRWSLQGDTPELLDEIKAAPGGEAITALTTVFGDTTLAVADAAGRLTTWFPASKYNLGDQKLTQSHVLPHTGARVRKLEPNRRNKSILALDANGDINVYYLTSERHLLHIDEPLALTQFAVNAKSDGLIALNDRDTLTVYDLHVPHPEASLQTLFGKVWYEKYPEPEYVWQSTGGTDEFEPKFSLIPLAFGSFKGTIYAMFFAIPLALGGAIYISQFTTHRVRGVVKPIVEIMASLPSVIIGFMIALWLAPLLKDYVLTVFLFIASLPAAVLLFFFLIWHPLRNVKLFNWINRGFEFVLMTPYIVLLFLACHYVSGLAETHVFGGDFLAWLYERHEIRYDQRNAMIIAFGLGFAVIPIVFTLSEDALSNVPKSLQAASLAVGASRWQTVVHVILPSASPGIFAGVIIGFGRAVGETMIVLMATGNTPIMDWSIFNGMRTLSANIAVEIPEAPVDGTLYRVLFLSAVLLFLLTSVLNTAAEIVRQRLRKRYGQFQ